MSRSARLTNYSHQMADVNSASGHSFNPHQLQPLLQHSDPQNQRSLWSLKLSLSRRMLSDIQWITTVDFIGKMQKETFIVLFTRLGRKLNKSLYSKTNNQIRDWDCLLMYIRQMSPKTRLGHNLVYVYGGQLVTGIDSGEFTM